MAGSSDLKPMPRMPWYPRDFAASTRTWPFIARAIYRELLDVSWDVGGLPAESETLRAMLGVSVGDWRKACPLVMAKFIAGDDGLLRNSRLEHHRQEARTLQAKRTESAIEAARRRWGNRDA